MPELPEVEICRRVLVREAGGAVIVDVIAPDPAVVRGRLSTRPSDALHGGVERLVRALRGRRGAVPIRHGKRIGWAFDDTGVVIHLGMSGRWWRGALAPAPRFGRLALVLPAGDALWFIDARRFGCVVPVASGALASTVRGGMGPDALLEPQSGADLRMRLRGRRAVKVALLDQRAIAGLGNIHAAEALWRAGIDPTTPCDALDDAQLGALAAVIPAQLEETITRDGEGELVYVSDGGENPFAVYGREGEPCPRCAAVIERIVLAGRATFSCPRCQRARTDRRSPRSVGSNHVPDPEGRAKSPP